MHTVWELSGDSKAEVEKRCCGEATLRARDKGAQPAHHHGGGRSLIRLSVCLSIRLSVWLTSCSMPEYSPSVFSRMMTTSTPSWRDAMPGTLKLCTTFAYSCGVEQAQESEYGELKPCTGWQEACRDEK